VAAARRALPRKRWLHDFVRLFDNPEVSRFSFQPERSLRVELHWRCSTIVTFDLPNDVDERWGRSWDETRVAWCNKRRKAKWRKARELQSESFDWTETPMNGSSSESNEWNQINHGVYGKYIKAPASCPWPENVPSSRKVTELTTETKRSLSFVASLFLNRILKNFFVDFLQFSSIFLIHLNS
jgi:hypothetical protein